MFPSYLAVLAVISAGFFCGGIFSGHSPMIHFLAFFQESGTAGYQFGGAALAFVVVRETFSLLRAKSQPQSSNSDEQVRLLTDIRDGIKELLVRDRDRARAKGVGAGE